MTARVSHSRTATGQPGHLQRHALALAALLATGAAALPAWAQQAEAGALEAVVITGGTREQKLADAPFAINAVGAEALRNAGPMVNLSEALAAVPGVVVANRSNYAQDLQISSRGFGARAGFGVRGLRLYTDGIPATMPDGQGQVAHFDLASADRVEVLRGPFSALYGNSSGGVIALYTAPITRRTVEAAVDFGSDGLRQQRLAVATPLEGGFSVAASLSNFDIDGFRPQSDADRRLVNARLGWQNDSDKVNVAVSHQRQRASDPLGLSRAEFDANPDQTTPAALIYNTRKTIAQTQVGASWQHRVGGDSPLQSTQLSAYTGQREVVQYLSTAPAVQNPATSGGGVIDFSRRYEGLDARLTWAIGEADLVTGVNFERQRDDRLGFNNYTGTAAAPTAVGVKGTLRRDELNSATTREVYSQLVWPFADQWQLTAGVRRGAVTLVNQDRFPTTGPGSNQDDSGSLRFGYSSPVLGLRHQVDRHLTLHASVSRGNESPTLGEVAYKAGSTSSGFNTALQAQRSQQVEVGAKWRSPGVSVDLALFQIGTRDEIGVLTNQSGRSSFQNVGRTNRAGMELGSRWEITPQWRTQLAVTALDAQYRDSFTTCTAPGCNPATSANNTARVPAGNRIAGTQRASGFADLAWTPGWSPRAEMAVEWRGAERTFANDLNSEATAGYGVTALRYRQDFALDTAGRLELLLRVDNIADQRHAGSVIVNEANGRYFETAPGRSALVSLRYKRSL
jgi:iron complex outermembrane recepter protein